MATVAWILPGGDHGEVGERIDDFYNCTSRRQRHPEAAMGDAAIAWLISGLLREASDAHVLNVETIRRLNAGLRYDIFVSVGKRISAGARRRASIGHGNEVTQEMLRSIYGRALRAADISDPLPEDLSPSASRRMQWDEMVSTETMRWRWFRVYRLMRTYQRRTAAVAGSHYSYVFWQRPDAYIVVPPTTRSFNFSESDLFLVPSARVHGDNVTAHARDLDFAMWARPVVM